MYSIEEPYRFDKGMDDYREGLDPVINHYANKLQALRRWILEEQIVNRVRFPYNSYVVVTSCIATMTLKVYVVWDDEDLSIEFVDRLKMWAVQAFPLKHLY